MFIVLFGMLMTHTTQQSEAAVPAEGDVRVSLEHYIKAWAEADEAKRVEHLEAAWTEDATYTDPGADVHGREALVAHIAGFLADPQLTGFSIVRVTDIDVHHQSFRFSWEMRGPDGQVVTPGDELYDWYRKQVQVAATCGRSVGTSKPVGRSRR